MSYCVNCGVELEDSASFCPLCHTPVYHPGRQAPQEKPATFPQERQEVEDINRKELAVLLSVTLLCTAGCCGLLNKFLLLPQVPWSAFVAGACGLLWVWIIPPLLKRTLPTVVFLLLDIVAIGAYLVLIAHLLHGESWLQALAFPIWAGAAVLFLLAFLLARKRSVISRTMLLIAGIGLFLLWLEFLIDHWMGVTYRPQWSLIVAAVCAALLIPLAIIRMRPNLRRQVRRRFHF